MSDNKLNIGGTPIHSSVKLTWTEDGRELLSIDVDGETIDPKEFNELLFNQYTDEEEIAILEKRLEKPLGDLPRFNILLRIIRMKTKFIIKKYCS